MKVNYEHQEKFLNSKNNRAILAWTAGTGKTHTASKWLQQKNRLKTAVVIVPKQIRGKWKEMRPEAYVYSFEDFKKYDPPEHPTAIVVDEADNLASPLFIAKKRSQRTEKFYNYLKENPQTHILLATATPVRSTPWNMHTLLTYIGQYIDWKKYRKEYFQLEHPPFLRQPAYFPVSDWRKKMQHLIDSYCHVALMKDMIDKLPEEQHEVITLPAPDYTSQKEWEPAKKFSEDHQLEQQGKDKKILEISRGYPKVVVVAYYRAQIQELEKKLSKDRSVYVLNGSTRGPEEIIKNAEEDPECFFIVQAGIGAGFEVPSFSCMIFASRSFAVRNFVQMKARIKRVNALKPVIYYYLLGGRADTQVHKNIERGKDFVPSEYAFTRST